MVRPSVISPKRRRTHNGPSAEDIAQTNSTIQFFTGQRQNRWMQGYVSQDANSGYAPTSSTQTPTISRPAVNIGQGQIRQEPSTGTSTSTEGATETSLRLTQVSNAPMDNTVMHESPTTTTAPGAAPLSTNDHRKKSLDEMARTAALPSPVSSDGNMNSPAVDATRFPMPPPRPTSNRNNMAPKQRGRPRKSPVTPTIHATTPTGTASPAVPVQQPVPSQSPRQQPIPRTTSIDNSHISPSAQHRPFAVVPSHPHVPPQPQTQQQFANQQNPLFDMVRMRASLETFQKNEVSKLPYNNVEQGRLELLRNAIDRNDIFYIVLSQLHTLSAKPALLPLSVTEQHIRAFSYLDILLCPNEGVSTTVHQWLMEFPAPIMKIYTSVFAKPYDMHVGAVGTFLERLPTQWDLLVSECKQRWGPPLVQDLEERLTLRSPVLQSTVFRIVARGVCQDSGIAGLEWIHNLDQIEFQSGRRRTPAQKSVAYQAYRQTMQAWKNYESNVLRPEQRIPEHQRRALPIFVPPRDALIVFQQGQGLPLPPRQPVLPGHSPSAIQPAEQQAYILADHQNLTNRPHSQRGHRMSVGGAGSPTQVGSAQQQPSPISGNGGGLIVQMPTQQHAPSPRLLFPHEGEKPQGQPLEPDTARSALHQAHLRSPVLKVRGDQQDPPRLYRFVSYYALSPRRINKGVPIEEVRFDMSEEIFRKIPETTQSKQDELPTRQLDESSLTVRLRCAAISAKRFGPESDWIEADNYWPDNLYLECNGRMLEPRRKLHHGRYLPIDLSDMVKAGENYLRVIVNRASTDTRPYDYGLAVEIVAVERHETITSNVPTVSASQSLAVIKKALSGTNDDDDIAITASNMTIKLFDPYSCSKIFDTPARGAACSHKDCFDLETFLASCTRELEGGPTVVDCWRCPICRGDARPKTLLIDGFLIEVRKELEKKGLLDTRAIIIAADGTWRPKEEERTGVRSASLEREERVASAATRTVTMTPLTKKTPEIIELD